MSYFTNILKWAPLAFALLGLYLHPESPEALLQVVEAAAVLAREESKREETRSE